MSRYKGRTSYKVLAREFPYTVETDVPEGGLGRTLDRMYEFHALRGIKAQTGTGVALTIATSSPGSLLIPKSPSNLQPNSMARCCCHLPFCNLEKRWRILKSSYYECGRCKYLSTPNIYKEKTISAINPRITLRSARIVSPVPSHIANWRRRFTSIIVCTYRRASPCTSTHCPQGQFSSLL